MSLRSWLLHLFPRAGSVVQGYRRSQLKSKSPREIFTKYFLENAWRDKESVSGVGSTRGQTARLRPQLAAALRDLRVQSLLDAPCGDFNWMREVDLQGIRYIGADIVEPLIQRNNKLYGGDGITFMVLDIVRDAVPRCDAILCRDCLVHFSLKDAHAAIGQLRRSNSEFLLTTTFVDQTQNVDIVTGLWFPINLQKPPFNWPEPLAIIRESDGSSSDVPEDKCIGVWRTADLPGERPASLE